MKIFRIIVAFFYGIGVFLRNMLYHNGLLRKTEVDIATICVGNLAIGGTGKTPHTEYLIRLLQEDYKVAVLSRGYKRKTKGIVLVTQPPSNSPMRGKDTFSTQRIITADTIGDEPMQIHRKFPDIPICVSADRVKGVRYIQEHCPDVQIIILDDAYQHRAIRCGYYILLTAENNLYVNDHILPWGRLREHAYRSHQADMVVITKCPEKMQPIDRRNIINSLRLASFQKLAFSWQKYGKIAPLLSPHEGGRCIASDHIVSLHGGDGGGCNSWFFRPLVLAGIAYPEPMLEEVRKRYPQAQLLAFADHHRYTKRDWKKIQKAYEKHNCDAIITTEKDAVRLVEQKTFVERWGKNTFVLPIEIDLKEYTEIFNQNIIRYVKENTRNR